MTSLSNTLNQFTPISLEEMDRVKLLNRVDTKFIFNIQLLESILIDLIPHYYVLDVNGKRISKYETLYYDYPNLIFYHQHHNGKLNRTKVRFRKYVESNLSFFEIKNKTNKNRTIKKRKINNDIETSLSEENSLFLNKNYSMNNCSLIPIIWNYFSRITLVHKTINERLTIDTELRYVNIPSNEELSKPFLVIAELKQTKSNANSDFIRVIKKHHIRPTGMSKYCLGLSLLNKELKSNNFKKRILQINKLKYAS